MSYIARSGNDIEIKVPLDDIKFVKTPEVKYCPDTKSLIITGKDALPLSTPIPQRPLDSSKEEESIYAGFLC